MIIPEHNIDNQYLEHKIFSKLNEYKEFYDLLSDSSFRFSNAGVQHTYNFDTYILMSIQGTIESINDILKKGRINDSYALLRKYYDLVIINIYSSLYLKENFNLDNAIVKKINDWLKGNSKIPRFDEMSNYIIKCQYVYNITSVLYKDGMFKNSEYEIIRKRCNDNLHYNYYSTLMLNNNKIHFKERVNYLNLFSKDLNQILILHLSYLFYIKDYYMSSDDYVDYLDCSLEPIENSKYWVATYIQDILNKEIKLIRPDIYEVLKENTSMFLE